MVYAVQPYEIMLRIANLNDRFDGALVETHQFNVNDWAREYYLEANEHLVPQNGNSSELLEGLRLTVVEMNAAGSVPKRELNITYNLTQWNPEDQPI
jgi:hypothetical protein